MIRTTTYSKARAELASLCDRVAEDREVVLITRRDADDVALISAAELEGLLETAHLLRSPKNARRLIAALERSLDGEGEETTLDALRSAHGLDEEEG